MAYIIEMPKLSDTMEEGGVSEWFKKEGEFVEDGDPLLSIETDKATMEYSSPEEGYLLKVLAKEKSTHPLGAPICVFGDKDEKFDLDKLLGASSKKAAASKADEKPSELKTEIPSPSSNQATSPLVSSSTRVKASPLAKKMAEHKGLDLSSLLGSGPGGRIIAKDVEGSASHAGTRGGTSSFPSLQEKEIPLTLMRKTIAKRLTESKNQAPHFYLTVACKTGALSQWRKLLNREPDTKISLNDLLIFVCSRALTKHPEINSQWLGDKIRHCSSVDLSIAVALPEGLITPMIRACEKMNIWEISKESKDLVAKARAQKLTPDEYSGGSFTISNLGMTRVESFTAVINSPQTCILAVGQSKLEPSVSPDGSLVAEETMRMTLSCDHRAVDGYMGALFLETLCELIENPLLLFS